MPVDDNDANDTEVAVSTARAAPGLCVCSLPPLNDYDTCPCTYTEPSTAAADVVVGRPSPTFPSRRRSSIADVVDQRPSTAVANRPTSSATDIVCLSPSPVIPSSQRSSTADVVNGSLSPAFPSSRISATMDIVDLIPSPAVTSSQMSATTDIVDLIPSPAGTSSQRSATTDVAGDTLPEIYHKSQSTSSADNAQVTVSEPIDTIQSTLSGNNADVTLTQSCSSEAMIDLTVNEPCSDDDDDPLNALNAEMLQAARRKNSNTLNYPLLGTPADNIEATTSTEADELRQKLAAATQELSKFTKFRKDTAITNPLTFMGLPNTVVTEIPFEINGTQKYVIKCSKQE